MYLSVSVLAEVIKYSNFLNLYDASKAQESDQMILVTCILGSFVGTRCARDRQKALVVFVSTL